MPNAARLIAVAALAVSSSTAAAQTQAYRAYRPPAPSYAPAPYAPAPYAPAPYAPAPYAPAPYAPAPYAPAPYAPAPYAPAPYAPAPQLYLPYALPSQSHHRGDPRMPASVYSARPGGTAPLAAGQTPSVYQRAHGYQLPSAAHASVARPAPAANVGWEALAKTTENRVIDFAQFGDGQRHVLVIGPFAGDNSEGVELADQLAAYLVRFPRRLTDSCVTIVRDPNPDGRQRRTAGNAHAVDIDRNFSSKDWRKTAGSQGAAGASPDSEAETRAVADLLDDLRPDRVILFGTAASKPAVVFAGPADGLARRVSLEGNLRIVKLDPAEAHGSFMSLAGFDYAIPVVRIELAPRTTGESNWNAYKRAILTAIELGAGPPTTAAAASPAQVAIGLDRTSSASALLLQAPQGPLATNASHARVYGPAAGGAVPSLPPTGQAQLYAPVPTHAPPASAPLLPTTSGMPARVDTFSAPAGPTIAGAAQPMGPLVPVAAPRAPAAFSRAAPAQGDAANANQATARGRLFTDRIFLPQPPIPIP